MGRTNTHLNYQNTSIHNTKEKTKYDSLPVEDTI